MAGKRSLWTASRFRLFLSHSSRMGSRAAELRDSLKAYAIDAFLAHEDIRPTEELERQIIKALDTCDAMAALLSKSFPTSDWTDQEVGHCLGRPVLVVPIQFGVTPYGFMARYQGLAGSKRSSEDISEDMFEALVSHDLTAKAMADAVISQFADSSSFKRGGRNMGLLEQVPQLSRTQLKEIRAAVATNSQLGDSYSVPARVDVLVASHR